MPAARAWAMGGTLRFHRNGSKRMVLVCCILHDPEVYPSPFSPFLPSTLPLRTLSRFIFAPHYVIPMVTNTHDRKGDVVIDRLWAEAEMHAPTTLALR